MSASPTKSEAPDILGDWRKSALAYWLPIGAIVASGNIDVGMAWRTAIWTGACSIMGGACLLNAIRCGRIHCYFNAPFFFAMATITLIYGIGLLPLGANGWNLIGLGLLAGGVILTYGPELVLGKYRKGN